MEGAVQTAVRAVAVAVVELDGVDAAAEVLPHEVRGHHLVGVVGEDHDRGGPLHRLPHPAQHRPQGRDPVAGVDDDAGPAHAGPSPAGAPAVLCVLALTD